MLGAYLRNNLCCLICLRHLNRSREVTNLVIFIRSILPPASTKCSELPSNISTTWLKSSLEYIYMFEILHEDIFTDSKFYNKAQIKYS